MKAMKNGEILEMVHNKTVQFMRFIMGPSRLGLCCQSKLCFTLWK